MRAQIQKRTAASRSLLGLALVPLVLGARDPRELSHGTARCCVAEPALPVLEQEGMWVRQTSPWAVCAGKAPRGPALGPRPGFARMVEHVPSPLSRGRQDLSLRRGCGAVLAAEAGSGGRPEDSLVPHSPAPLPLVIPRPLINRLIGQKH